VLTGGSQRQLTLPPAPDSARHARRFVAEVLAGARLDDDLVDVATLLTSELVTNGIVHAHTELRVVVDVTDDWVRVEVNDGNPLLPARREYDESAMTGRGMEMVELLSHEFGAEPVEGAGKRVWFRLSCGDATGVAAAEGTQEPPDRAQAAHEAARSGQTVCTVTLAKAPVALYCAWQQQADSLLREALMVALDDQPSPLDDAPLAAQALGTLAAAASAAEIFALRDTGVATAEVRLEIPTETVPWFPILRDVLARATVEARAGQLLTPPSLPEIVALRNWVCDEISRQAAGLSAQPWSALPIDDAEPAAASPDLLLAVRESTHALVAADASNRIVAVSPAAAELLGWDAADLTGRRLVTIIPPRLRDRHVAGFTRHLLDGSNHIVNTDVEMPALRHDGTEVPVMLRIERRPDPATRALLVATLTPRD
jgi:PAS domain S-box-containing protein